MREVTGVGGVNIAMKIPKADYEATLAFYRDILGFELTDGDVSATPTVSHTASLQFGPNTLWLASDAMVMGRATYESYAGVPWPS